MSKYFSFIFSVLCLVCLSNSMAPRGLEAEKAEQVASFQKGLITFFISTPKTKSVASFLAALEPIKPLFPNLRRA